MNNISFSGTWADLLAALQTLTPEQLAQDIVAVNNEVPTTDVSLEITTERHYELEVGEPWVAESKALREVDRAELDTCDFAEAGEVYLLINA
jgi:hypothetical protein